MKFHVSAFYRSSYKRSFIASAVKFTIFSVSVISFLLILCYYKFTFSNFFKNFAKSCEK